MNLGTYPLAANMVNQINRVDTISNNLANLNTTGFKEDRLVEGSFNYYLQRAKEQSFIPTKINIINNTIPKIDGSYVNKDLGAIIQTGNRLDFALKEPDIFFKVKDNKGNILLTRDGSFKNMDGFLVTSEGYKVLNINNEPIAVDENFESQLVLIKTRFENLQKIGNNNYKILNSKNIFTITNTEGKVLQGALEKSNVNAVAAMVKLISAQRKMEQAQKALNGIDEINSRLISDIGNR